MLLPYLEGVDPERLLFPMPTGRPARDARDSLAAVFARAEGVTKPTGKAWHLMRHTYGSMRLQTTEGGQPVAPWTVAKEMGHGSLSLLESIYGHLLKERKHLRGETVDFRPLTLTRKEKTA